MDKVSTDVAHSVRCRAVEAHDKMRRAEEESSLIHTEMNNVVKHFTDQHIFFTQKLSNNTGSRYSEGLASICIQKLAIIEQKLLQIKQVFKSIGKNVSNIPTKYFNLLNPHGCSNDSSEAISDSECDSEIEHDSESECDSDDN